MNGLVIHPLLVVIGGVGFAAIIQSVSDPRVTPTWISRRIVALVGYALHALASIVLLAVVVPQHTGPVGPVVALAGWFGLGLLMLRRLGPEADTQSDMVRHFGLLDLAGLVLIAAGLTAATGLI